MAGDAIAAQDNKEQKLATANNRERNTYESPYKLE
jgi:hypothetical protein